MKRERKSNDVGAGIVQPHESGSRKLVARSHGKEYVAHESLEAARAVDDGIVIFEGDYGGQIYLVCPVKHVRCSEARLKSLLIDLDAHSWRDPQGAKVVFENYPVGTPIPGGMGGGRVAEGLWLHPDLEKLRLRRAVEAVLAGDRERLK